MRRTRPERFADVGVHGRILLRLLRADPFLSWPCPQAIASAGLSPATGWPALQRLLMVEAIEKRTHDGWIRIQLTARGRRWPL